MISLSRATPCLIAMTIAAPAAATRTPDPAQSASIRLPGIGAMPPSSAWAVAIGGVGLFGGAIRRRRAAPR